MESASAPSGSPTPSQADAAEELEPSSWVVMEPQTRSLRTTTSDEEDEEDPSDAVTPTVILEESFTTATTIRNRNQLYTADDLMTLLQHARLHTNSLQQVVLHPAAASGAREGATRGFLPAAYLQALMIALIDHPHVQRVRLVQQAKHFNDTCAALWADLIRTNRVVTDWQLTKSEITNVGGHCIAAALRESTVCRLRRLVLENSQVTDDGLSAIIEAVAYRPTLQIFKIGKHAGDALGPASLQALIALLQRPDCALRKLDLRSCQLGDSGVVSLAREALVVNTSLRSLCLGRNHLHDTAVVEMAWALRRNAHLQTLDVQYNPFTDTGAVALAETLQWHNDSLQKIKLRHCPAVSETMKQHLLELLLVHAHGPELAQKTKLALETLLLLYEGGSPPPPQQLQQQQHGSSERTSRCITDDSSHTLHPGDDSRSSSYDDNDDDDDDDVANEKDQDGGPEGVVRETSSRAIVSHSSHHRPQEQQATLTDCVICFDEPATVALLPCLHRNCCQLCAAKLKTCHMCRATIVKVFPLLRHHRRRDSFYDLYRYRTGQRSSEEHPQQKRPSPCLDEGGDDDNNHSHNTATVDCTNNS